MNIPIEPQEVEYDDLETCIFCTQPTIYWFIEKMRPVCPVCSVMFKKDEIDNAPYNY